MQKGKRGKRNYTKAKVKSRKGQEFLQISDRKLDGQKCPQTFLKMIEIKKYANQTISKIYTQLYLS